MHSTYFASTTFVIYNAGAKAFFYSSKYKDPIHLFYNKNTQKNTTNSLK